MRVPNPKSIASSAIPSAADDPPFSCSTNLSKEALDHLRRMHLSTRALEVCLYAHNLTFGNAGWHRQQGKSELSCTFDLASWAESLGVNRSNLQRIIARLVLHRIIFFAPLVLPGRATFTWNVNFAEWQVGYDSHRSPEQAKNLGWHSQKKPSKLSTQASDSVPSELSTVDGSVPPELSLFEKSRTTRTKDARSGIASSVAALTPNKSTEKEITEESVAYATQRNLPGFTDPQLQVVKASTEKTKKQTTRYKKTQVTREQQEEMWLAWEAQAGVVKRKDMSLKETKRFYGVMTRLYAGGVTPEEFCSLTAALVRSNLWKSNYTARPSEVEDNLSTLRPIARGEVPPPPPPTNRTQKGNRYERHDGTWTGNHGKDAAIVTKC